MNIGGLEGRSREPLETCGQIVCGMPDLPPDPVQYLMPSLLSHLVADLVPDFVSSTRSGANLVSNLGAALVLKSNIKAASEYGIGLGAVDGVN